MVHLFHNNEATFPGISDSIDSNFDANGSKLRPMSTRHTRNHGTYSHLNSLPDELIHSPLTAQNSLRLC